MTIQPQQKHIQPSLIIAVNSDLCSAALRTASVAYLMTDFSLIMSCSAECSSASTKALPFRASLSWTWDLIRTFCMQLLLNTCKSRKDCSVDCVLLLIWSCAFSNSFCFCFNLQIPCYTLVMPSWQAEFFWHLFCKLDTVAINSDFCLAYSFCACWRVLL